LRGHAAHAVDARDDLAVVADAFLVAVDHDPHRNGRIGTARDLRVEAEGLVDLRQAVGGEVVVETHGSTSVPWTLPIRRSLLLARSSAARRSRATSKHCAIGPSAIGSSAVSAGSMLTKTRRMTTCTSGATTYSPPGR